MKARWIGTWFVALVLLLSLLQGLSPVPSLGPVGTTTLAAQGFSTGDGKPAGGDPATPAGGIVSRFPICTDDHDQYHPGVAYNPATNQFLAVWSDFRGDSAVMGSPVYFTEPYAGPEFPVEDYPGYQPASSDPAVAYNSTTTQFLAVWHDLRNEPDTGFDIYGRLANADSVAGPDLAISTAAGGQTDPELAYNSTTNQFLVVWEDARLEDFTDIYGRIVNADGSPAGEELPISIVYEAQLDPALAYNPVTNQYLVVWVDRSYAPWQIMARFVDADGSLGIYEFPIASPTDTQDSPHVVYNATDNQFLVVWQNGYNIHGRILNADGSPAGNEFAVCDAGGQQRHPAAAHNSATDRYLVVWEDDRDWDDIYGRLVYAHGSLASDEFAIATTATHLEVPDVVYSASADQYLVVWEHEYCVSLYDCPSYDIYGAFLAEAEIPMPTPVITVGVAAAISGWPEIGWRQINAAQLAVDQVNDAGGIEIGGTNYTVALATADSGCDETQAVAAANALLDAGAAVVVGHTCSPASMAAQPIYEGAGVAMVSPSSSSPRLTEQGYANVFRVMSRDDSPGIIMSTYFRQQLDLDRATIIEQESLPGAATIADAISSTFTALGGTVAARYTVSPTAEFTATLTAIMAENPDAIFYLDYDGERAGALSAIAHGLGMPDVTLGWSTFSDDRSILAGYAARAGVAAEGDYAAMVSRAPEDMPGYEGLAAAYQAAGFPNYGDEPEGWGAFAYDAAQIVLDAIVRAGSTNPADIQDGIAAMENHLGVVGLYRGFDAKGDVIPQWAWLERYQAGRWASVRPNRLFLPLLVRNH